MTTIIPMPGNHTAALELARAIGAKVCEVTARRFPDGESYVRLMQPVEGERVIIVCTLADPDAQFLRLVFAAGAARVAGASRVELIAPYLAYMRQDRRFADGEAVSARHFARLLSQTFDRITTIDPHLHRIADLSEIFTVPARALHGAPLLARWVVEHVENALIIGPDEESRQWVEEVAQAAGAPHAVLHKVRQGDAKVAIRLPDLAFAKGRQPVLVDDIVSSGATMLEAAAKLRAAGFPAPICLAVHGLFSLDAYALLKAVCKTVVTTGSVPHPSNAISVAPLLREAIHLH